MLNYKKSIYAFTSESFSAKNKTPLDAEYHFFVGREGAEAIRTELFGGGFRPLQYLPHENSWETVVSQALYVQILFGQK